MSLFFIWAFYLTVRFKHCDSPYNKNHLPSNRKKELVCDTFLSINYVSKICFNFIFYRWLQFP